MSVFVSGFNGFSQIYNSSLDSSDITPLPVAVDSYLHQRITISQGKAVDHQTETNKTLDNCDSEDQLALELKDVIVSWDRISYLWSNGSVSLVGGPLSAEGTAVKSNVVCGVTLQSLCNSGQELLGIDDEGSCILFHSNSETPVQKLKITEDTTSKINLAFIGVYSCENQSVILHDTNRMITLNKFEDGSSLLRCPLNFSICVKSISCGKHHILLSSVIGVTFSFGNGSQGQLGHGTVAGEAEPRVIEALEGVTIIQVAAGGWHSMALSDIGDVYVWGWNEKGQLGLPCRNLQLKDQNHKTVVGTETQQPNANSRTRELDQEMDKDVPENSDRIQVSDENFVNVQPIPVLLDFPVADPMEVVVTKIACGSRHSAAVLEDGIALSWGCNEYGQLGHGDVISRDYPKVVELFLEKKLSVHNVFCGFWNSVFFTQKCGLNVE